MTRHRAIMRLTSGRRSAAAAALCAALVASACLCVPAAPRAQDPGAPGGLTPEQRAERLERAAIAARAGSLLRERMFGEAIELLVPALARFPDDDQLVEALSTAYLRAGRPLDAAALLEGRLARTPGRFAFVRDLGTAYLDAGMPDRATAAWHSILGGAGGSASYYCEVARLEWNAGMYDRAIETLREGKGIPTMTARCSAEILRLERMRGNFRTAFVEGIAGLQGDPTTGLHRAIPLIESFREAGTPADLVRAADSLAARGPKGAATLRMLAAVLRLESGDVAGARRYLAAARAGEVDANELFQYVSHLLSPYGPAGAEELEAYIDETLALFTAAHRVSAMSARLYLDAALRAERAAERGGPGSSGAAGRALAHADSVISHRHGRAYMEQAALIRAGILLDHLFDPEGALGAIERVRFSQKTAAEAERLRMRALLAAERWEQARARFAQLASSPDSFLVAMGRYGEGMSLFYRGGFDAARDTLAALAERLPSSEWANDALATAVLVREAQREAGAPLALLGAALLDGRAGRTGAAVDSLDALADRFPRSVLAPRALFEAARLLERAGDEAGGRTRLERLAERYPLDRHAPRAIELLAETLEDDDPAAAASWYAVLIDRYPEDPWAARVRERYRRVRERLEAREATEGDLP